MQSSFHLHRKLQSQYHTIALNNPQFVQERSVFHRWNSVNNQIQYQWYNLPHPRHLRNLVLHRLPHPWKLSNHHDSQTNCRLRRHRRSPVARHYHPYNLLRHR